MRGKCWFERGYLSDVLRRHNQANLYYPSISTARKKTCSIQFIMKLSLSLEIMLPVITFFLFSIPNIWVIVVRLMLVADYIHENSPLVNLTRNYLNLTIISQVPGYLFREASLFMRWGGAHLPQILISLANDLIQANDFIRVPLFSLRIPKNSKSKIAPPLWQQN